MCKVSLHLVQQMIRNRSEQTNEQTARPRKTYIPSPSAGDNKTKRMFGYKPLVDRRQMPVIMAMAPVPT